MPYRINDAIGVAGYNSFDPDPDYSYDHIEIYDPDQDNFGICIPLEFERYLSAERMVQCDEALDYARLHFVRAYRCGLKERSHMTKVERFLERQFRLSDRAFEDSQYWHAFTVADLIEKWNLRFVYRYATEIAVLVGLFNELRSAERNELARMLVDDEYFENGAISEAIVKAANWSTFDETGFLPEGAFLEKFSKTAAQWVMAAKIADVLCSCREIAKGGETGLKHARRLFDKHMVLFRHFGKPNAPLERKLFCEDDIRADIGAVWTELFCGVNPE